MDKEFITDSMKADVLIAALPYIQKYYGKTVVVKYGGNAMIDPRSILGLFAFVGKDALLVAPDDLNPNYFMKLVKRMGVAA